MDPTQLMGNHGVFLPKCKHGHQLKQEDLRSLLRITNISPNIVFLGEILHKIAPL